METASRLPLANIDAQLDHGENIVTESVVATAAAELDLKARFNGGIISAICKISGGESSSSRIHSTVQHLNLT